jgi:beta-lactamase regulating signal transducer with metallopeptidase domain
MLQYALWAMVILKLALPFGFESNLSLFSAFNTAAPASVEQANMYTASDEPLDNKTNPVLEIPVQPAAAPAQQAATAVNETKNTAAPVPAAQSLAWTDWALIAWAIGALSVGMIQALCAMNLRRRAWHARLPLPERIGHIARACASEMGLRRRVCVVMQDALKAPVAMGVLQPMLVLPKDAAEQTDEQLRHICLHELTHVKHGDLFVISLMGMLRALYWFNPLVWLCFALVRRDMEAACDAHVLRQIGLDARQIYIGTVLQFAGREKERRLQAAMGMADGRMTMEQRIRGMFRQARTGRRGRALVLAVATLMLAMSVLTACQPTPEEPVVMNKQGSLVSAVLESAAPENSAAPKNSAVPTEDRQSVAEQIGETGGHMTLSLQPNDAVTINVDADIVMPEYNHIPMVRVKPSNFTAEQFDAFINQLTGGLPLYYMPDDSTVGWFSKEEILDMLTQIQGCLADASLPKSTRSAWEDRVKDFKEELKTAINRKDEKPYDGKLTEAENNKTFSAITQLKCYMGKSRAAWLSLWQTPAGNDTQMQFDNADYGFVYNTTKPYEGVDATRMGMTYEQAKAKVMDFVHTVDGNDSNLSICESSIGYIIGSIANYTEETSPQAYVFRLARSYGGVTVKPVSYLRGVKETEIDYSKQVSPESLYVTIDDSGIAGAYWSGHTEYIEDVAEDVPLKDFDSIKKIFEDYCRYKFTWTYRNDALKDDATPSVTLSVKRVEMNLMVIPEKDNLENYITVPVWDFIGDMTLDGNAATQEGSIDEGMQNVSILTINAIDGTVIDREQGY